MKRIATIFLAIALFPAISFATLIDRGSNMIYDDVRDITWYNVPNNTNQTWYQASSWAANLSVVYTHEDGSVSTVTDWRLPSVGVGACTGYDCTDGDIGSIYYGLGNTGGPDEPGFVNRGLFTTLGISDHYFIALQELYDPIRAYYFNLRNGDTWITPAGWTYFNAIAVFDGDVALLASDPETPPSAIPEPSTCMLIMPGLLILWRLRRPGAN